MVLELFDFAPVLPAPFLSVCFGVSYNSKLCQNKYTRSSTAALLKIHQLLHLGLFGNFTRETVTAMSTKIIGSDILK